MVEQVVQVVEDKKEVAQMKEEEEMVEKVAQVESMEYVQHLGVLKVMKVGEEELLHEKDMITDISLIKESVLNQIHVSEQCCFLLKLGKFYLDKVFPNIQFTQRKTHRHFNNLANAVLGMKTNLRHCHATMRCPCGDQAFERMEDFKDGFYKLEPSAAVRKAVGDLNILFRWMEKNFTD
ncbi:interleukin-20-like [Mixophyes fleayi]|uniref:interleukin-20-like n=1 Tax=Mixophyes fleayi TaxID=3061075 RepID=UPI003F4E0FE8